MSRLVRVLMACVVVAGAGALSYGKDVEFQPLAAQASRVAEAMDMLGSPMSGEDRAALDAAVKLNDAAKGIAEIQRVLDRYALAHIHINPESRVKVARGAAPAELAEKGWRTFLLRVDNEAGVTAPLKASSPNALPMANSPAEQVPHRWLEVLMHTSQPLQARLSGLGVEYAVVSLYSRDAGKREAKLAFDVGQGTQDLGFRNEIDVLFTAKAASDVTLKVRDVDGKPTTAGFVIRDKAGRVHPSQAKRLAPDFHFHPQIYRRDGQTVKLPAGTYTVAVSRGPEYLPQEKTLEVAEGKPTELSVDLKRWIDPAATGWYSGDHHIHAAGCAHYTNPTEGVHAPDMYLHCLGEDLKVGANLTWGPCFDYQKQFFTGTIDKVSTDPRYILRYDVEVSGFGSHRSGHLCLLRLKDQIPPGGDSKNHWPTLCLNTLRWAKKQGAVCGPAHSGWGLEMKTEKIPAYDVPPYSGIGANEYIADVTHLVPGPDGKLVPAVDFISLVDTPAHYELNMWYHTLNCGYRTRGSGETDFPCIYGERVGLGRSYVKLDGALEYNAWCEGIRKGRNYVSDGRSHLMEFRVNGTEMGVGESEVALKEPGPVKVTAQVGALLPEKADPTLRSRPLNQKPFWHIERARVGDSKQVKVELIVNGYPVAEQLIDADGTTRPIEFDGVKIERSSWVAMRILPSSHTNPIFVMVADKPIRASKRSAEWCLKGVDVCWGQKQKFIAANEMEDAKAAYDHARKAYEKIVEESTVE